MLVFTLFLAVCSAVLQNPYFQLEVIRDGNPVMNVTYYKDYNFLVSDSSQENDPKLADTPTFLLVPQKDGGVALSCVEPELYVDLGDLVTNQFNEGVLLLNETLNTTGFGEGDFLEYKNSDKFYSCNAYILDKYVDFLSTNSSCFLAREVQLRLIHQHEPNNV